MKEEKKLLDDALKSLEDLKHQIDKLNSPSAETDFVKNAMPFLSLAFDNLGKVLDEYIKQFKRL